MPICGAKTKDGKQCQNRVSDPGQRCHLHTHSKAKSMVSGILKVCEAVTTIGGTVDGVHWLYQHARPFIEPLLRDGLVCPERFWWDSFAWPFQRHEAPAEIHSKLEAMLEQMRQDHKDIEDKLALSSRADKARIADAYAMLIAAIRAQYPHLSNAMPHKVA
jgi:hypothetical protein